MMRRNDEAKKGQATPALRPEASHQASILGIVNRNGNIAVIYAPCFTAKVFYRCLPQVFEPLALWRSDPLAHRRS